MKLKPGMTITVVRLDDEELRLFIVAVGGDPKEQLSLRAPLAVLLGAMTVGDVLAWQSSTPGVEPVRVELVEVEEAKNENAR